MQIVVADDSVLLREGLVRILTDEGHDLVGIAHDGRSALEVVAASQPDVVVLDVRMPPTFTDEGIAVAEQLRDQDPATPTLLLSQHVHVGGALKLFESNPRGLGYLLKDRVIEIAEFLDALQRVAGGGSAIDPLIVQALVTRRDKAEPLDILTPRELEVLSLMAEGLSNSAIAAKLFVSARTIETHVNSVFLKLELAPTNEEHRRVRAVITYLSRQG